MYLVFHNHIMLFIHCLSIYSDPQIVFLQHCFLTCYSSPALAQIPFHHKVILVFSLFQIFLYFKPTLQCNDNKAVCKFTNCTLYSAIQITSEIIKKDITKVKLLAAIPFCTLLDFDIEHLVNQKTVYRMFSTPYVIISLIQLCYLSFTSYDSTIRGVLLESNEESTCEFSE